MDPDPHASDRDRRIRAGRTRSGAGIAGVKVFLLSILLVLGSAGLVSGRVGDEEVIPVLLFLAAPGLGVVACVLFLVAFVAWVLRRSSTPVR